MSIKDVTDSIPEQEELLSLLLKEEGFNTLQTQIIHSVERNGKLPLSYAQQRLWFLEQLEPGNPTYNISLVFCLLGLLNVKALKQSLNEIARRHEVLRTTFTTVNGHPIQIIAPALNVPLPVVDLRHLPDIECEKETRRLASEEAQRIFDLARGPLLRTTLLRLAEEEHILFLTVHHIVFDGWSKGILFQEMSKLYEAFSVGKPSPLPELSIQYADFAYWQRQRSQEEVFETQLIYWKQQLGGDIPVMQLPTDRPRPSVQTFRGAIRSFALPKPLTEALKRLSQQENVTLFMTLLAAFKTLLYRHIGQEDIFIGSPIANRNLSEIEGLIGFFANTLVLRTDLSGNPTFRELLDRVCEVALGAYDHQDIPFEKLVESLQPERNLSHTPLFQVMFVLQNAPMTVLELPGLTVLPVEVETKTAKFDLTLFLTETKQGLSGKLEYNTDLFTTTTITRMVEHFQTLLGGLINNPDQKISELPLLTEAERHQILVEWNDTYSAYPQGKCVHQLFEEQVKQTPDAIAVKYQDQQITYSELNKRANRLARLLVEQGVRPESLVALLAERSVDFLTVMLAIFKAGGVYLPLNVFHPPKRLCQVLEQSEALLILTETPFESVFEEAIEHLPSDRQPKVLLIQELLQHNLPDYDLPIRCTPNNLAYVLYTSGSTGVPKAAMIEHRGMLNHIYAKLRDTGITAADIVAQNSTQNFDVSVWQFLGALLVGGCVHIFNDEIASNPAKLLEQLERHGISILEIVPSLLRMILDEIKRLDQSRPKLSTLRWLIPTGEALPPKSCREWLSYYPAIPMLNAYGFTECSDDIAHYAIYEAPTPEIVNIPVGCPIQNTRLYVLDSRRQPVPIGVTGELYVGGVAVGRGYLNNSERTDEVFIRDPFSKDPEARLYKTGDLIRYLPDGNLEFFGRKDFQVKIHGFRIELGEIEATLAQHPAVRETIVIVREDQPDNKQLVSYVVPTQNQDPDPFELREFLKEKLPHYMIPSAFVIMEILPLTPNGKVDRRALPLPEISRKNPEEHLIAPRTPTEKILCTIWSEILEVEHVSIHDNFFELGGHSLLATQLVFRIRETFQFELPVRNFFGNPTVASLAQTIAAMHQGGSVAGSHEMVIPDFNAETALDITIRPENLLVRKATEPSSIFLTGATGFIGAFLLHELLRQTTADIYCLVRAADIETGHQRIKQRLESYFLWHQNISERIIPVIGDLSQAYMGLSNQQFQLLAGQIDIIYHNGALVNFIYPYDKLKPTNVLGTQEILRLATQVKLIPVHYVSTLSVFNASNYSDDLPIREDEELKYGEKLRGGYAQSKWVAEKLVTAAYARGVPIAIYRLGIVSGHSETGGWNTNDYVSRFIKGCIQLGSMPDQDRIWQLTPVDYVSKAIVHVSGKPTSIGKAFHLLSPYQLHQRQLADWIRAFGYTLTQLSYDQWLIELMNVVKHFPEHVLYPLLPFLEEKRNIKHGELQFDCRNLLNNLSGSNIVCPSMDTELVAIYISSFIRSGFLAAPPSGGKLEHLLNANFKTISD